MPTPHSRRTKGKFANLRCPSSTQYRGDTACAGMFSRMGKMRRPRFMRSISRYRVAEAGKPAVSKCKRRIFKMRRISFGRTGQSSRRWLGKNWRKAAATSSSPLLDGIRNRREGLPSKPASVLRCSESGSTAFKRKEAAAEVEAAAFSQGRNREEAAPAGLGGNRLGPFLEWARNRAQLFGDAT